MSFVDWLPQLWSKWGLRFYVFSSLLANVLLSLLSWTRQRSASDWRAWLLGVAWGIVWVAYQGAELAGTGALSNLSLCSSESDASVEEQQVIAFWAPLLLLHLGGPDTITAYAMEDNALSPRKLAEMVFHVLGAAYVLYKYVFDVRRWTMLATASAFMLPIGIFRYVEKWYALSQSKSMMKHNPDQDEDNDPNRRKKTKGEEPEEEDAARLSSPPPPQVFTTASSNEEEEDPEDKATTWWSSSEPEETGATWSLFPEPPPEVSTTASSNKEEKEPKDKIHDDDEALRLAQDLFHICRRALADSAVNNKKKKNKRKKQKKVSSGKIFRLGWRSMCTVVEMELSLLYEALYTKAVVLHTSPVAACLAYLLRLLSPLATAAALLLFNQHIGGQNRSQDHDDIVRGSFVKITYLLLGFALALDVVWLLRALGSTWTYAFLKLTPRRRPWWARWLCLHVVVEYPVQWLLGRNNSSFVSFGRTWSGTIGRYNLLKECSVNGAHHRASRPWWRRSWSWVKKKVKLEEMPYLSPLPRGVKESLMERVLWILESTDVPKPAGEHHDSGYTMVDIRTFWGQQALNLEGAKKLFEGVERQPKFGHEFEEDVLVWHMATCVFLSMVKVPKPATGTTPAGRHVVAIKAMSEYLMFFVAVRRHMLPGLVLHSLFEATLKALGEIWDEVEKGNETSSYIKFKSKPENRLAESLMEKGSHEAGYRWLEEDSNRRLVLDAALLATTLIKAVTAQHQVPQLLDFIFNVWVDKLLYAAVRCSRESHAKQLSRGGDLTTLLWMILHHAGLFRIGEERAGYEEPKFEEPAAPGRDYMEEPEPPKAAPWWDIDGGPILTMVPPRDHGAAGPMDTLRKRAKKYDIPGGYVTLF